MLQLCRELNVMTMILLYKLAKPFYLLTVSVVLFMHSALYLSMKDPEKGIKELKLEKDKRVFNHCFTGKELLSLYSIQ